MFPSSRPPISGGAEACAPRISRLAAVLTGAAAILLAGTPTRAHMVADWTEAAARIASQEARSPGPPDTRLQARVALAMFEAANAVDHRYVSFLGVAPTARPASAEAAAARAAYEVLVAAHPSRKSELSDSLALALSAVPDANLREQGQAAGLAAAQAVLSRPAFRTGSEPAYIPAALRGRYIATGLPGLPSRPMLARPYFMDSVQAVAPPPPPPLRSARYGRDVEEVRRLGGKGSEQRTPEQTALAVFWSRADVLRPLRELTIAARRPLIENARTYALIAMAMDDASNAVATAKLEHGLWRPITAIRNGADDGNAQTRADPDWEPLLPTPPHPEYPCGHCIMSGAFATIVAAEFGPDVEVHLQDGANPASSRRLKPDQIVQEASQSRILAGAHFRFSTEVGADMGRAIATRALQALPPARLDLAARAPAGSGPPRLR